MGLNITPAAERQVTKIMRDLRAARRNAGISQNALAEGLPFRGRAISEWETCAIQPKLGHLILLAHELGQRLVIIGPNGERRDGPLRQRPGEAWGVFQRRRLATPLRNRRQALGMPQEKLSELVGVTRDSIQRWELARVPPRPIAHAVWAQVFGCSIALRPIRQGPASGAVGGDVRAVRQPVPW